MAKRVAVIGSGVAGLAAAIRLKCAGHEVTVFEANDYPGGKLSEVRLGPYRFDAGPSLFTLPELVDELFDLAGEPKGKYFSYEKVDPTCRYFYPDGTKVSAFAAHDRFAEEMEKQTGEPAHNVLKAIKKSAYLYSRLSALFMFSSLQDWRTFFSKQALKAYLSIHQLGFFRTMDAANRKRFRSEKAVQLFDRYATYNGSSPFKTPATMNIIPHLEMSIGAYFPTGGMHTITLALYGLAKRLGVSFHFQTSVERILHKKGKVTGIQLKDTSIPFDRVVSNMDIVNSYRKLLPDLKAPNFLLNQPKSSSALIFYWGIKGSFEQLDLHNIFFSQSYEEEFDHIFEKGTIYTDPTIYINITAKKNPADAPKDCENWFTMINVPNNTGQDWENLIQSARASIIQKLSESLNCDLEALIEVEEVLDPIKIESKTSSALGALYGNSSNNLFAAFLRHANVSQRVKGLYFCGGSVHPGGGIPMSLSSAKLVAKYFQ
ncbi:1-hydroxycarotenoid 3,4-desaturase CrtD [Marinoscillum furvescens]|uniref:Phytoene desaturase n=1 Tax=Marinoscillum furvescens DSM 4134 TaxID=1122208 RepID=A0A3D9KZD0_MARFU|nr:1-hydroxycarotenoid 3,4-desaturase CrtD [Marinoscillum furvescens]RED93633.1 phytoene desaturase [Marinoscillum furvescens DSM 4134]